MLFSIANRLHVGGFIAIQVPLLSILACVILMQNLWSCLLSTWDHLLTFLMICIIQRDIGSLDH
jgi:hypothetical protein